VSLCIGSGYLCAQVNVAVNAGNVVAVMPDIGIGLHTSVYANIFGVPQLPAEIAAAGVRMLRYPGGNYASIYHWSNHTATGGYAATASHFGNFVDLLLDGSEAAGMVTVNYGANLQNTLGGQPKEAAAWVAYANGDASLFGTPADIPIGVDAGGNDWRTVGYWARLRGLTPAENTENQYDRLAINHDAPLGIQYWEIGNEINGNGYYSDINANWNWQNDLHSPYDGSRGNEPALSPTAYANNFNEFVAAMKAVDPTIKIGAVLVGPGGVGDVADPARNWDANVLPIAGPKMDFGIIHWYPGGSSNVNNNTNQVLNATDDLPGLFAAVRDRIDTHVGPGASDEIEVHLTEFGYFGAQLGNAADGVFAANTYATALAQGVKSVHWLELSKNSFVGDSQSGLVRGGAFHGIQLFSHIADAGSEFVQTTSTSGSVEVHSTVLPDGRLGMLIANLNSSGTSNVNISISGINLDDSGTQWLYGPSQTTPLETTLPTGLGNTFSVIVPARSIMALLINAAPTLPGDVNEDGVVDAADYVVWRAGLGTEYTEEQYDIWRANFGRQISAGGRSSMLPGNAPEPATWWLFLAAAAIQSLARRRKCQWHST
jgi:hypothetical protein